MLLEMSEEKEFSETCTGGEDIVENFISVELNSWISQVPFPLCPTREEVHFAFSRAGIRAIVQSLIQRSNPASASLACGPRHSPSFIGHGVYMAMGHSASRNTGNCKRITRAKSPKGMNCFIWESCISTCSLACSGLHLLWPMISVPV